MCKSPRDLSDLDKDTMEACVQPFKSIEIRRDFLRHSSFLIPNSSLGPKALCGSPPIPVHMKRGGGKPAAPRKSVLLKQQDYCGNSRWD